MAQRSLFRFFFPLVPSWIHERTKPNFTHGLPANSPHTVLHPSANSKRVRPQLSNYRAYSSFIQSTTVLIHALWRGLSRHENRVSQQAPTRNSNLEYAAGVYSRSHSESPLGRVREDYHWKLEYHLNFANCRRTYNGPGAWMKPLQPIS